MKNEFLLYRSSFFISLILLLFTLLQPNSAYSEQSENLNPDLNQKIHQLIDRSMVSNSLWAVVVRDSLNQPLVDINSTAIIRPASNIKLLTSAAIMDELGTDFRFSTKLYGNGNLVDNVWHGDIHFLGGGDPTIDGRFYDEDPLQVFNYFIDKLLEMGIMKVEGDLFGNESLFDDIRYPRGWEWDDLSFYYAPEISALSFNGNCVDLEVHTNFSPGSTPEISWYPFNTDYVHFVNEQLITPRGTRFDEQYHRILGTNTIKLRSTLPQGYIETEPLSVSNPAKFFIDTFKKYAASQGIEITGELRVSSEIKDWSEYTLIHDHRSAPLSEILKAINQDSDNLYTEMLLKKAASKKYKTQGSTELGLTLVREFAESKGLNIGSMRMRDGSGMAPATLITGHDIAELLYKMQERDDFSIYFNSLAVAGLDARLQNRFHGSPLLGELYGKTGFISGTRSLSGYMMTGNGERLIFSIITNNYTTATRNVDALHQAILELVYRTY